MSSREPRSRAHRRPRRRPTTLVGAVLMGTVLALAPTGCSDGSDPEVVATSAAPSSAPSPASSTSAALEVHTRITRVAGDLTARRRTQVTRRVHVVIRDYLTAAFADEEGTVFDGFTRGIRAQARRDRELLTATGLLQQDGVRAATATAYLNVLAPRNRPAGATAQVEVAVDRGATGPEVVLRGRLVLTPTGGGWRIFGYDVARSDLEPSAGAAS